nr:hypothetical protein B0A51_13131 [Rachicladosporium sp. CCFEE 5018]
MSVRSLHLEALVRGPVASRTLDTGPHLHAADNSTLVTHSEPIHAPPRAHTLFSSIVAGRVPALVAGMLNLLCLLWVTFALRYTRLIAGIFANILYKPYPLAKDPKFRACDVTVVIPTTFKTPAELVQCLRCIVNCGPAEVIIVTAVGNVSLVRDLCALNSFCVKVLGVEKLNKRNQMIRALQEVATEITVFADDDVFWPRHYLEHLLAIFEDSQVGAGGTRQRTRRNASPNCWNFLGISYLERRVWNNITTNAIDGSISTLSGRTAAYRTEILKNEEFYWYFTHDSWLGRPLNTDDDKCLTRFVYSRGWRIAFQTAAVLETSLEDNPKYVQQCLRWARAHWRGNFTVMTNESYWRGFEYCWGTYVIYVGQFQTPAILIDGTLFTLLYFAVQDCSECTRTVLFCCFAAWLLFTKVIKLLPHFCRYPEDLRFLPLSILFGYLHGLLNLYALFTLTTTAWGSQSLEELERPKAQDEQVVRLLKETMAEVSHTEPTPGKVMEGDDYFSATLAPVQCQG